MNKYLNDDMLDRLQLDLDGARSNYSRQIAKVNEWKSEIYGDYASPDSHKSLESQTKSKVMMRDIRRTIEGSIPNITDPFLSNGDLVELTGKTRISAIASKMLNKRLNKDYRSTPDFVATIEGLARDLQEAGTCFIKTSFVDGNATFEAVDINELIIDPTARKLRDAAFVIQRRKVSISDILSNPDWYGSHTLDSLKSLMASVTSEYEPDSELDDDFTFNDRAREMVELFEYYGVMDLDESGITTPVFAIFSETMVLNFQDSPYPAEWNGIPFDYSVYSAGSTELYGNGITDLIGDYQKVRTGFIREVLNNANNANSSQTATRKGSLDIVNRRKFLMGESYEYVGEEPGIIQANFNPIPDSTFRIIEDFKREGEELSGVSRNNGGVDLANAANKTATAASLAQTNADKRLLQIVRHLSSMFESMFSKWIDLYKMLNPEILIPREVAQQVSADEMANMMAKDMCFDIVLTVGTGGQKIANINNSAMMLAQIAPLVPMIGTSISLGILADMATDMDKPLLAQQLMQKSHMMAQQESQPKQQDPIAEQAAQLDMAKAQAEIQKIAADTQKTGAEVAKVQSETQENVSQIELNRRKAEAMYVETELEVEGIDITMSGL